LNQCCFEIPENSFFDSIGPKAKSTDVRSHVSFQEANQKCFEQD
jgi:hypothetical protein